MSQYGRITRWRHAQVRDVMQQRSERTPEAWKLRRQTAEHPFTTFKAWMGSTHFLTRTLPRDSTEMSLHILSYNMKRVTQIVGVKSLMRAMAA